jgi:hypothetical protein
MKSVNPSHAGIGGSVPRTLSPVRAKVSKVFLSHQAENGLLYPLATALDQNHQHDYGKDAGYNSNKCYIVHVSFLSTGLGISENLPLP